MLAALEGQPGRTCLQVKKVVYKNRIRLKEFFVDFDKVSKPCAVAAFGVCQLLGKLKLSTSKLVKPPCDQMLHMRSCGVASSLRISFSQA